MVAHEVAHAWIGGLVGSYAGGDWLIEALASYLGRLAVALLLPGTDPWDPSPSSPPPDHGYAADARLIRAVGTRIGEPALLAGIQAFVRTFAGGLAGPAELGECWSTANGQDCSGWAANRSNDES